MKSDPRRTAIESDQRTVEQANTQMNAALAHVNAALARWSVNMGGVLGASQAGLPGFLGADVAATGEDWVALDRAQTPQTSKPEETAVIPILLEGMGLLEVREFIDALEAQISVTRGEGAEPMKKMLGLAIGRKMQLEKAIMETMALEWVKNPTVLSPVNQPQFLDIGSVILSLIKGNV